MKMFAYFKRGNLFQYGAAVVLWGLCVLPTMAITNVQITSPADGTQVMPGDVVSVTVRVANSVTGISALYLYVGGVFYDGYAYGGGEYFGQSSSGSYEYFVAVHG